MIFLLHHTNNKNLKSIKDNGLWATPVCNTHDPTEWFDFVFNYDTQTYNKDKIEKDFKDKFAKSLFWINFTWFDIDVDINKETWKEVIDRLLKEGDKTGSSVYVNLVNFYQDKTVGADINSSILIVKDKFDLEVKKVIATNGFKCIANKITYDENIPDKAPKVTVDIETLANGCILFKPEIEPSGLLAFKKRKSGKNGEWYFGEKEFRYLFHRLDDIMLAGSNLEHINISIQSSSLIEIPRSKFAGIICNLKNGSINKITDTGIEDCTTALRIDPNDAAAYNNRGNAYKDKGMNDRAIEDYNAALRLDPNYAPAWYNRGNAYKGKGMNDRAIEDYNAALRLDPKYAAAYNNRGNAYYNKGMNDRAIEDYNAALRIDPSNAYAKSSLAFAYNSRGNAYWGQKNYRNARAEYEKALQLDPNDTTARDNLEKLRGMGY